MEEKREVYSSIIIAECRSCRLNIDIPMTSSFDIKAAPTPR